MYDNITDYTKTLESGTWLQHGVSEACCGEKRHGEASTRARVETNKA